MKIRCSNGNCSNLVKIACPRCRRGYCNHCIAVHIEGCMVVEDDINNLSSAGNPMEQYIQDEQEWITGKKRNVITDAPDGVWCKTKTTKSEFYKWKGLIAFVTPENGLYKIVVKQQDELTLNLGLPQEVCSFHKRVSTLERAKQLAIAGINVKLREWNRNEEMGWEDGMDI